MLGFVVGTPSLVADGAVEWVVNEEQFEHAFLCLVCGGRGQLGADDHSVACCQGAGCLGFGHGPQVAFTVGHFDVDEALAAGACWLQERVVAKTWDVDSEFFCCPDDEGSAGHRGVDAVNVDGDVITHEWSPAAARASRFRGW